MPDTDTKSLFFRPAKRVKPSASAPGSRKSDERAALREIYLLASAGLPASLCEARRRLSAINLISQEGLGTETLFEMVCRIVKTGIVEPVRL